MSRETEGLRDSEQKGGRFQTALKERAGVQVPKDLLQTPSPIRKHHYRPSNIKILSSMSQPSQQGEDTTTYVLIAKIESISNDSNRYWLKLSDETYEGGNLQIYSPKSGGSLGSFLKGRSSEESVEQLQYEPTRDEGHPYFKLWVKQAQSGWALEKVERLRDHNEIPFHWLNIIEHQLLSQ